MKKYLLITVVITAITLVGCGKSPEPEKSTEQAETSETENDTEYLDYINKIEVGDSLDKINEIIGFEGEVLSDNATYSWEIGSGGVSAVFKTDDTSAALSVDLNYNKEDVINKDVVIKDLEDIKQKVNSGIHYDDFKELVGGVDGVLISKNSITKGYVWRNDKGAVVNAAFTHEDNMCNSFVGSGL